MKRLLPVFAATALLVAGGCGGDETLTAERFGAELDDACAELSETVGALPQRALEEEFDSQEIQRLGDEAGAEFFDSVEALEPPDDLADAHATLLDEREEPPSPLEDRDAFLAFTDERIALFEELGAEGCAETQRATANAAIQGLERGG